MMLIASGILFAGVKETQAKVKTKKYTVTVQKGQAYQTAALGEELECTVNADKKYKNYKQVITVKAVQKKKQITETHNLAIQTGTTYSMKKCPKDIMGLSDEKMLNSVYAKLVYNFHWQDHS